MESMKMKSMEERYEYKKQKTIDMVLKDVRNTGEILGITASTAFRDESERDYFLEKAKLVFDNGIETTLNMPPEQMLLHMFKKAMEIGNGNYDRLMEALK